MLNGIGKCIFISVMATNTSQKVRNVAWKTSDWYVASLFVCLRTWAKHSQDHPNWVRRLRVCLFSITPPNRQTHSDFRGYVASDPGSTLESVAGPPTA